MNRKEIYIRTIGALQDIEGVEKISPKPVYGFTHTYKTKIGLLYFRIDCQGPVLSFFGNFLENTEEALKLVGHWKYNLHLGRDCGASQFIVGCINHLQKLNS